MKLTKTGVNDNLWEALCTIQADIFFKSYYLAGGTALSLQIGHRISDDIDLFTNDEIKKDIIFGFLRENICSDIKIINDGKKLFQLFTEEKKIKIDFVQVQDILIDNILTVDGVRLAGINDISAMKISAAATRGNEAKDFIDIFYLLKYMSIDKIFENFRKKYKTTDDLHYVRSIMYFDDVPENSWNAVKMIKDKISKDEITKVLTSEISGYEKRLLLGVRYL